MSFIQLRNVGKTYALGATKVKALSDVDLTIARGEFTAVWGPSGSGKSTLLNILATIDQPSAGHYHFDNRDVCQLGEHALTQLRQTRIGVIFQHFNLIPVLNALENVMLPLQIGTGNINTSELKKRALKLLDDVGVANRAKQRPDQLSGGQRQRVAIARALIAQPEFVIADEPTANLDSQTSQTIIQLLRDLNQHYGTTFVFSTHHSELLEAANRHIRLVDGKVESDSGHAHQAAVEVAAC